MFARGEPPEATYTFKHALVQEAAYESLLKRTRQQLHGRVVDVLVESASPSGSAAEPEVVARHAEAAGRIDDAIAYYQRAGERAQARSAHEEAIGHFEQAIALLVTQPECRERDAREAALQLALAGSRAVAFGYGSPDVEAAEERARRLYESAGDARGLAVALSGLAAFSNHSGRVERGGALAARVLEIGEQTGDSELLLRAHCNLGLVEIYRGRFAASFAHFEAARELYRPDLHQVGTAMVNLGVRALSASAWGICALGFPDRALTRAREAVERARELAHPFSVAHALLFETVVHTLRGDAKSQRERAAEVIALSEAHGFPFWLSIGQTFHAAARVAAGEVDAVAEMEAGFALTATSGSQGGLPASLAQLAEAYLAAERLDEALATVEAGLAVSAQTGQPFFDSVLHQVKARILLAGVGSAAEAEAGFRRALEIARTQGARFFELRAATSLAQLLARSGPARRGVRSARSDLRLVHGRLRHRGPRGGAGAPRLARMEPRTRGRRARVTDSPALHELVG